jgi:hypothetical protein
MKIHFARAAGAALVAFVGLGAGGDRNRDAAQIDKRISGLQPTALERRIDQIGWARDIRTALRLGRQHGRPVFLFTMDGRFAIGRC